MSVDPADRARELLDEADGVEDGAAKVQRLEEAIRLADAAGDVELGFRARRELVDAGTFGGAAEKVLVAFSWCLAQCDRDPAKFPESQLLWQWKWVVAAIFGFPQISREQIERTFEDMVRRYKRCGLNMRPVWKLRWTSALDMGEPDRVREFHAKWRRAPRDWNSDCEACDQNSHMDYLVWAKRDAQALQAARPILEGRMRCKHIPHFTHSAVLVPLFRLGRLEEAAGQHLRGYRMIARNREFLRSAAEHLHFLVVTDNLSKALRLLEKHLAWALESWEMIKVFHFHLAARLLLERLARAGWATVAVRLPREFPARRDDAAYETAALAAWFDERSRAIASDFDRRNGNGHYASLADVNLKWLDRITPHRLGIS